MAYVPFAPETGATYRLANPTNGAVAVFNDPFDPSYVGMLSDVSGLDSPEVRESAEDLVQADGGTHGYFWFGRRPITLTAQVFGHGTINERNIRVDRANRACTALRADSTLSWKPSDREENLLINPKLANNATGWALNSSTGGTAGTNGRAAMPDIPSEWGWRVNYTQPADTTTRIYGALSTGVTIGVGKTYTVSAEAYVVDNHSGALSTNAGHRVELRWYNAAGTNFSTTNATNVAITTGTRARVSATGTAPAGAVTVRMQLSTLTNASSDVIDVYWTKMRLTEGTQATYADGDTTGWSWSGDANASASGDFVEMFTPVRLNSRFMQSGAWNKELSIPLVSEYATIQSTGLRTVSGAGGATLTAENKGSWPATPILRVTGPTAQNFTITNTAPNPDLVLRTTGSLIVASGETLEIDTLNHTAYFTAGARNGQSANRFIDFGLTTWPLMPTGNNTFVLSGTGTLVVNWRDTWV